MSIIYLDNAATTEIIKPVFKDIYPYITYNFGNASSLYSIGRESRSTIEIAREYLASTIHASKDEIYFTSCGTESNNFAIKSVCESYKQYGNHIITTKIEHHSVLNTCKYLEENGFEVTYLDVDESGIVNLADVYDAIRPDTILISIMFANNEIGTIQPIKEIGEMAYDNGILFHVDAVQAYCHIPIDVSDLGIDLMSVSGHKFHAMKGTGFLYINNDVNIKPYFHGGSQENQLRAGTENVAGIVSMKSASNFMHDFMKSNDKYVKNLRNYMLDRLLTEIPCSSLNGTMNSRLPGNINICLNGINGEQVVALLDARGICVSSGSACALGETSHVLKAIGLKDDDINSSIRISIGEDNTLNEINKVVDEIKDIVNILSSVS